MANPDARHPKNIAGPWFVDDECINCSVCTDAAPQVFDRDEEGYSFVKHHLPQDAEAIEAFREALEDCPVEAIGDTEDASTLS